ncbi:rhamnogalacturonan lyase B N-terminal domain-containing protein [Celerinatantimonas sp. YJH-8]|uniref:rhamnogalacturonan lyase B N-terminal domain-containing protein n=1 Tax=Celerinatantimonas sp. YJH-8 TaxID=3228714 RepID=UPI0038BE466A
MEPLTHIHIQRLYRILGWWSLGLFYLLWSNISWAAFSLTSSHDFYTVDTDAGLVFSVRRVSTGTSRHSPGDIESLKIDGVEYQYADKGSQINSGFDWLYTNVTTASVTAQQVNEQTIKITVTAGNLTHYYMARRGEPRIYMATYFSQEPTVAPYVRYILRMRHNRLPLGPTESDLTQTTGTIESADIYSLSNGQTRSKHYSNHRAIDWHYIGGYSQDVGIWIVRDNFEGGSNGPFYRSLLNKNTNDVNEITYMMNYNEAQTEAFRTGVLNHYTLVVTDGNTPSTDIDTSWFASMSLRGYQSSSQRGRLTGVGIEGRVSDYHYVVGLANEQTQYWTYADDSNGSFSISDIRPGTYTLTIYKNELAVYQQSVSITASAITQLHTLTISDDPHNASIIWRIGHWDGTPQEFLNGDKVTTMHPSDVRMANWQTPIFQVGSNQSRDFPAYIWKDVNNGQQIQFQLSNAQRQKAHTLRIGITDAYANARPQIQVNQWSSAVPASSTQPSTRTLTVGTYRGNNHTFIYEIPASAWNSNSSWNTLTINIASGSGGNGYLSPGISVDCIDLLN